MRVCACVCVSLLAFDTVNHTILLNKLKRLCADDLSVQCFISYLIGRIDDVLSCPYD